ncbi:MAG: GNAT family N-acetyltransferase [Clostridia bacterium]|nr:GNAT family N-acetyltransferase [Clostridia bacterium]
MIRLETVTPDNWRYDLSVAEDQKHFVASSAVILARAYAYRDHGGRAFVIYNDETPVGMAFYCDWFNEEGEGFYNFSQFFIDKKYQRRGFGLKAAELVLDMMREEGKFDKVVLCYVDGADAAREMYKKLGFYHTGDDYEDEIGMEMPLK